MASLISGWVGTVLWKSFLAAPTGVSERLASYVFAFLMTVLFSLLIPEKGERRAVSKDLCAATGA